MSDKSNIVIIGMPGCGKTTLGKMLAEKIGYNFVDIDEIIEQKFDKIVSLFKQGEEYFRHKETICAKETALMNNVVIATGAGIVTRDENMKTLSDSGIIVFIDRSLKNIMKNIIIDTRPLLKDGKEKLKSLYNDRYHLYNEYADIIIDGDKPLNDVLDEMIIVIREEI